MSSKICRFNILGNYRKTDNRKHNQKKDNALFFNFFTHSYKIMVVSISMCMQRCFLFIRRITIYNYTHTYMYIYFFTFSIHAVKLKVLTYILIIPQRSAKNPKYYTEAKSTFIHVSNNLLMNKNFLIAAQGVGKT